MSLVPVMDIRDGRFVLRCTACGGLFDSHDEFNAHLGTEQCPDTGISKDGPIEPLES